MSIPGEPEWLSREAILQLQEHSVRMFGGLPGIRDAGLMEAALHRPQQLYAYSSGLDIFDLAAGYATAFVRNHPFIDGNKRAAFAAALVFLNANGFDLEADQDEATAKVLALAAREIEEAEFAAWLRGHSAPFEG